MAPIAEAFVRIRPDVDRFGPDLTSGIGKQVDASGKTMGQRFGGVFSKGLKVAAVGIGAGFVAAAGGISRFVGDARESQKVSRLTAAAVKSTGQAAHITADQVGELSTAISNRTGVDDEAIQSGANLLLTFTNVRNEVGKGNQVFDRATLAATNMSAALGTEASQSALQLGKALNDPVKGVTALTRSGVSFTDQQKAQIKTLVESGKTLAAQKIILGEVGKEFGGAAKAAHDPVDRLKVVLGNLSETVGGALLPYVDKAAGFIGDFVTQMQDGTGAGGAFADGVRDLADRARDAFGYFQSDVLPRLREFGGYLTGTVVPALSDTASFIRRNADFFVPFAATIVTVVAAWKLYSAITKTVAAVQLTLNAVMAANPIGLVIIAVAGLVAGLVVAYKRSETFRDIVNKSFQAVQTVIGNVVSAIVELFRGMLKAWTTVIGGILGAAASIAEKLHLPFAAGLRKASNAFDGLAEDADAKLAGIADSASHWGEQTPKNLGAGINGQRSVAVVAAGAMANKVGSQFAGVTEAAYRSGENMALGFGRGITARSEAALAAAGDMANKAVQILNKVLVERSPSKRTEESGVNFGAGFALGIDKSTPNAVAKAKAMAEKVFTAVRDRLEKAKGDLSDLLGQRRSAVSGLVGGVMGGFLDSLTQTDADGNPVGAAAGAQAFAGQAQKFAAAIASLVGKVPGSLISAVAAAGPTTGLQAAEAILSSDTGAISAAYGAADTAARQAGRIIADVEVPPALVKAQQDMVTLLGAAVAELRNPGKADTVTLRIDKGGDLIVEYVNDKNKTDARKAGKR